MDKYVKKTLSITGVTALASGLIVGLSTGHAWAGMLTIIIAIIYGPLIVKLLWNKEHKEFIKRKGETK